MIDSTTPVTFIDPVDERREMVGLPSAASVAIPSRQGCFLVPVAGALVLGLVVALAFS